MTRAFQCPDCDDTPDRLSRREFLSLAGAAAVTASSWPRPASAEPEMPETHVRKLYDSLTESQRKVVAFDWDHVDPRRGLLRTRVANNWRITRPSISSDFYSSDQQELIRTIFEGLYDPDWLPSVEKQLQDDAGGYGRRQSIAIFGRPGDGKFELVMTGRHMTIRCDGNTTEHLAFGGPIFYGHAAESAREKADHPGNVYWPQAVQANRVFEMLDGAQRDEALVARAPRESAVGFRGADAPLPGIRVSELAADQQEELRKTLEMLLSPYRSVDRQEVRACLEAQGGLERCSLAFYASGDIGNDQVWDNWRLEGPAFVWHFRGSPHVHVWVHVAADPSIELNAG